MAKKGERKPHAPRNFLLSDGLQRFSKSAMYKKRGIWKKKKAGQKPTAKQPRESSVVEKQIKGEKNGGKRKVAQKKTPRFYPTEDSHGKRNQKKRTFKVDTREKKPTRHSKKLRKSLTPGTVVILVAGRHRGKRVVFLKQLESGLLLVTGPFKFNGCPLRRINQRYVIATKTKIDVSSVKIADSINDNYFRRIRAKAPKDASIFDKKTEEYKPSETRVKDQVEVDNQLLKAIKSHEDGKLLRGYLGSLFSLKNKQYPHEMIF